MDVNGCNLLYYPFTNCSPVILHADILLELLLEFNFSGKYQYYVTPGYIIQKSYCNFKYSPGYIIWQIILRESSKKWKKARKMREVGKIRESKKRLKFIMHLITSVSNHEIY